MIFLGKTSRPSKKDKKNSIDNTTSKKDIRKYLKKWARESTEHDFSKSREHDPYKSS